jgi:hypothetical protein
MYRYTYMAMFVVAWIALVGELLLRWRLLALPSAMLFLATAWMVLARKSSRGDIYRLVTPVVLAVLAGIIGILPAVHAL